jgi:hypothetical protein
MLSPPVPAEPSTLLVNAGTVANPTTPSTKSVTAAGSGERAVLVERHQHRRERRRQQHDRAHQVPVGGAGAEQVPPGSTVGVRDRTDQTKWITAIRQ